MSLPNLTADDLKSALIVAKTAGLEPIAFRLHVSRWGLEPAPCAEFRGVPIDATIQTSHLLCEGGVRIELNGDW